MILEKYWKKHRDETMQEKQLEKYNDGKMEIKIKPQKLFLEKNIKPIGKYKSRKIESRET